jgi:transposase-like protein
VAARHGPLPPRRPRPLPRDLQQLVGAAIRPIFWAADLQEARRLLGETVTRLEPRVPKVARLLVEAEPDLLACSGFPVAHRAKLRSTNPLEGSTARSADAPTWSGCSPTTPPCCGWPGVC